MSISMFRFSDRIYKPGDYMDPHVSVVSDAARGANDGLAGEKVIFLSTFDHIMYSWIPLYHDWKAWGKATELPTNVYRVEVEESDLEARHINSDLKQWITRKEVKVVEVVFASRDYCTWDDMEEYDHYNKEAYVKLDTRNPDDWEMDWED